MNDNEWDRMRKKRNQKILMNGKREKKNDFGKCGERAYGLFRNKKKLFQRHKQNI